MSQDNEASNGAGVVMSPVGGSETTSLDGFRAASPQTPFASRPELLLGAALLGGLLLGRLVRRLGS